MDASFFIFIDTVTIGATEVPFIACDRIFVNTAQSATTKICHLGFDFKPWFREKVEPPFGGSKLCYSQLSRPRTLDCDIITALGGEDKAETSLTEICLLMEAQRFDDQNGPLLADGWGNVFFVRDVNDVLRTIWVARYGNDGWRIHTENVDNPFLKTSGFRIFYRA